MSFSAENVRKNLLCKSNASCASELFWIHDYKQLIIIVRSLMYHVLLWRQPLWWFLYPYHYTGNCIVRTLSHCGSFAIMMFRSNRVLFDACNCRFMFMGRKQLYILLFCPGLISKQVMWLFIRTANCSSGSTLAYSTPKVPGSIPDQHRFHAVRIHVLNGGPVCFVLSLAPAKDPSALPKLSKDVWLSPSLLSSLL